MPSLSDHQAQTFVKVLYIGDSSSGKTGSLVSLVKADYKLRILDLDNGLDPLRAFVLKECPEKVDNVQFITVRDPIKAGQNGPVVTAKAYVETIKYLSEWEDKSVPSEWGPEYILVIDSLTALGKSAYEWARAQNPTAKEQRTWYWGAQQSIENLLGMLTSEAFHAHVIVISHVKWTEDDGEPRKGYPTAIGSALGPVIPRYFNNLILATKVGSGPAMKRRIRTVSTAEIDLKVAAPFKIDAEYELGTGMATIFDRLKSGA